MIQIPSHFDREPKAIWEQFFQITQIPRPSKKEGKFREYLKEFASKHELDILLDSVGNVVLKVPASKGRESDPVLIIQNHLDMVCDSRSGINHNFETDPIQTEEVEGWIKAKGTTLGADNGIGCAAALAIVTDQNVSHPRLELLFTSDEETGLNGAIGLDSSMISGKKMLNLDTEEWGSLYVGCAGGMDFELETDIKTKTSKLNKNEGSSLKINVFGLVGGHSGCDIHLNRASANKILLTILSDLYLNVEFEFVSFNGGKAHNIIPREATCLIQVGKKNIDKIKEYIQKSYNEISSSLEKDDDGFQIELLEENFGDDAVLEKSDFLNFLNTACSLPHGAFAYMWEFEEPLVKYSSNLARVICLNKKLYFEVSARFTKASELSQIKAQIQTLAQAQNLTLSQSNGYPSWTPDLNSKLLSKVKDIYQTMFNIDASIKAIHAGLECGILKEKLPDVDVVSFGPTIMGAHSPDERIEIQSVEKFWKLLSETLRSLT